MEHGTQGVCMRPARAWGRDQAHYGQSSAFEAAVGPFNVFENGSTLDFLLGWSGGRGLARVGHSFTLFKCQITFVHNGRAHAPCAPWRSLVRSIVPLVASFAWLIAERRPLAPLVTCHVSWLMLMATHCWRPVTPARSLLLWWDPSADMCA